MTLINMRGCITVCQYVPLIHTDLPLQHCSLGEPGGTLEESDYYVFTLNVTKF